MIVWGGGTTEVPFLRSKRRRAGCAFMFNFFNYDSHYITSNNFIWRLYLLAIEFIA